MQIIQPEQNLLRDLADDVFGNTAVLVSLDKPQQVFPQYFKDHTNMRSVGTAMPKVIKQRDNVTTPRMSWIRRDNSLKQSDFIFGSFCVMVG